MHVPWLWQFSESSSFVVVSYHHWFQPLFRCHLTRPTILRILCIHHQQLATPHQQCRQSQPPYQTIIFLLSPTPLPLKLNCRFRQNAEILDHTRLLIPRIIDPHSGAPHSIQSIVLSLRPYHSLYSHSCPRLSI